MLRITGDIASSSGSNEAYQLQVQQLIGNTVWLHGSNGSYLLPLLKYTDFTMFPKGGLLSNGIEFIQKIYRFHLAILQLRQLNDDRYKSIYEKGGVKTIIIDILAKISSDQLSKDKELFEIFYSRSDWGNTYPSENEIQEKFV